MRALIYGLGAVVLVGAVAGTLVYRRAPTAAPEPPSSTMLAARYTLGTSVDRVPRAVLTDLLARMKHDPRLANPNEWFNKTDVIDARYPMRRLVLAGTEDASAFVVYDHGGRGLHRHLVIYRLGNGQPQLAYAGAFVSEAATLEQVRMLLHSGLVIETDEL